MKALLRHRLFLIGFLFVTILFVASVVYSVISHGKVPGEFFLYNAKGEIIGRAPFSPLQVPPLGTNRSGKEMVYKLLVGAKFTIGVAIVVAAFRIVFSFIIGLFYGNFFMRFSKYAAALVNSYYYVPISLLCYLVLSDVVIIHPYNPIHYTFKQAVVFELIILVVVALPTTSLLIANQMNQVLKKEFIDGAKVLGGGRLYILRRHVLPHLWPKILIQFFEQIIQTLVLIVHLGVFKVLFGGSKPAFGHDKFVSLSGEWSGMIGNNVWTLLIYPWLSLETLVAFALLILSFNYMERGLKEVLLDGKPRSNKKKLINREKDLSHGSKELSFERVHNKAL